MKVLMPLPDIDFDTTEAAVAWQALSDAAIPVVFATERGSDGPIPACDPLLLTGVLFGQLGADEHPKQCYARMIASDSYQRPVAWADIVPADYDGLVLSGGHAKGMRQYLGSQVLAQKVAEFFLLGRPVAAICHGPIVLARALDPSTGKSVIHGYKSTSLPKYMEWSAYLATFWARGKYYRTYDEYVEDEMRSVLADGKAQYVTGPVPFACIGAPPRGTQTDDTHAMVVVDRHYVSARWPGDAYLYARTFVKMLRERDGAVSGSTGEAEAAPLASS